MENKRNIKLFPFYKLFAYDVMFYYAISILFLTTVKHISISNVVLLSSLYSVFQMIFQLPASLIVDKIGYKKCIIVGNVFCTTGILTYILAPSFSFVMLGDLQVALGFALKAVSESPFIYTVMKKENMENEVSKVEAKGSTYYFIVEAFAAILAGYLYLVNPYIPIILALLAMLTSTILSLKFDDSKVPLVKTSNSSDYFYDLKNSFKFISKSERMKAILIFCFAFAGITSIANSYYKVYLTDIKVSSTTFGYIAALLNIISAIGSSYQDKFESKRRKKTLSYISIIYVCTFIFIGLAYMIGFQQNILLTVGILCFLIQNFFKGSYRVIMKKYLNNFTTSSIRPKIMSVYYLVEMAGSALMLFLASKLLMLADIGISYILEGVILFLVILLVLEYMRPRVGLKPEEYKEKDITFINKK